MGKYALLKTASGWRFNLLAANGQIIAGSEVYASQAACVKGMQSVVTCAPEAPIADLTVPGKCPANPRFELYQDRAGRFRFRLKARNGKIIAVSEGYNTRAACENGIESVKENADSPISEEK